MNTRAITALAAVGVMSIALSACSTNAGGVGGLTEGDSDGGGRVTILTSQAPWNPAYDQVIAAYEEATGVDVEVRAFPNDEVKTQMLNDAQTGNHTFDVYQINEVDLAQFNAGGLLLPLQEADPDYELDPEIFTYNNLPYWDDEARAFTEDGVLTSVPLLGNIQILVYRTDVYEQLGLSVPATWEQTLKNAQAVVDSGATRYGFVTRTQGVPGSPAISYDFAGILFGMGGSFFVDEGRDWTPAFNTPEAIAAATMLHELAELGPEDSKAVGQAEAIATMQAGDAAQLDVVAAAASSMNDEANSNVVGKVGFPPLPGSTSATGIWNLALPADLPEDRRAAALDFIDWVTSEEGMEVFVENGGIPTRSDAYDADGIPENSQAYLDAVAASSDTAKGAFRFEFIADFLNTTEPVLAAIADGDIEPEAGMLQLQEELTEVVRAAGYLS